MLDREVVERLSELLQKHADPWGPWEAAGQYVRTQYSGHGGFVVANCSESIAGGADTAMLIAEMRMALPELLRVYRLWMGGEKVTFYADCDMVGVLGLAHFDERALLDGTYRLVRDGDSGEG